MHLLLNFGHTVTQSLLLNNTIYYDRSLWEADNDLYGQQIPYFNETHRFNARSVRDSCEAYMGEHKKLMDVPIWQCNISVKW